MKYAGATGAVLALLAASAFAASVTRTEANNGNLVMEDVPPIPADIVDDLNRYQNVRSGNFQGSRYRGTADCTASGSSRILSSSGSKRMERPNRSDSRLRVIGRSTLTW